MTSTVCELKDRQQFSDIIPCPDSLADLAAREPANGVYLVARSWQGGRVLELDAHFDRLERSARALGHALEVPRGRLRRQLERQRQASGWQDVRFRVTAVLDTPAWWRISMEEARAVSDALLRDGVRCRTLVHGGRRQPEVKSTAWLRDRARLDRPGSGDSPVYETLLLDQAGGVLEGSSSNFYAVIDGTLVTAGEGVLQGIARRIVLTVARPLAPVRLAPPRLAELGHGSEAFISSATRGVVPVRQIDDLALGPPGPITRQILSAYDEWLTAHLEPLLPVSDCTRSG